jgi:hypothetical protein
VITGLLITGCSSGSTQEMLGNCDRIQTVTSAFTEEYFNGNYTAATAALMVRVDSLAPIRHTEEENILINDITSQILKVMNLMSTGKYNDNAIVFDFLTAINSYNSFCVDLFLTE